MAEATLVPRSNGLTGWTLPLVCFVLAATAASAGQRQAADADRDSRTNIRQIESAAEEDTASATAEPQTDSTGVDQLGTAPADPAMAQVPTGSAPALPLVQVGGRDRATGGSQLSTGGRSAQAAAPLSSRGQSRPQAVVRLRGADACDPGAPAAGSEACARVIENRSSEYRSATAPVLSPEQRLLIDQQQREVTGDPAAIVRRLGRSDVDADARDAQSVASLVLPGNPTQSAPVDAEDPTDGLSPETVNLIEAIVQNAQGAVPQ
ncbi:hypothetical protein [Sphingomonas japonica]|uniref:Secreted protein n=1 Tax=Sphingomonas japonica TaxID=511662 RepID=A0ABX0U207_9SPHN|nr:hypothetical protein [Sphingomonas japonica]NIJ24601.1 hypothetical protein [Sphingomonas japonica]